MSQRPVIVGLLVCDQVIIEERTHNVTLVNCFTTYKAEQFPSEGHRFTIFAALTDGLGDVPLEAAVERLDQPGVVFRRSHLVRFADPLKEVRFILRVVDCTFPAAGVYEVTLSVDGDPIGQHRFQVE